MAGLPTLALELTFLNLPALGVRRKGWTFLAKKKEKPHFVLFPTKGQFTTR